MNVTVKLVNKTIKLLCLVPIIIGTFSLSKFAHAKPQCEIDEYSLLSYLVNGEKVCSKSFSSSDIVSIIKVLDIYWDLNTTSEGRFKLLSDYYKNTLKKVYKFYGLKNESEYEYSIPSTESDPTLHGYRTFTGYHIRKIQSYSSGRVLEITMDIRWSQEAYGGTMTYIFGMTKTDNIWEIISITN